MTRLYIFDVDGTLVEPWTTNLLPGVKEWFDVNQDIQAAFATNQGGVGLRYWMEQNNFGNPEQYPTEDDVFMRLSQIEYKLCACIVWAAAFAYQKKTGEWLPTPENVQDEWRERFWRHNFRKPGTGMVDYILSYNTEADDVVMVGESEEDRLCAEAAGIQFIHADEFFGRV